ncbi:unnamed protein product [Alopecurus aequalis]
MQNASGKTVLDDLPESVITREILLRLPAEDILRCRVVQKSWRHATSTQDFLLAHHHRQTSLPVIDLIKREGKMFDRHLFVYTDASHGATSRKLSQQTILWYPNPCAYKSNLVIHGACDGLLVVSFCDREGYFDVCNPVTRQRAPLPLLPDDEHGPGICIAGFYQHLASREYRMLYSIRKSNVVDFHVLAVGYNESRPIKEPPLQEGLLDRLACSKNAPVLNRGNLHWLLARYYPRDGSRNIIVFDTEVETFQWMHSPPSEVWKLTYKIDLSALEAAPQLDLPARTLREIATLKERELLIELRGCALHCDLGGKFLGKMECDEDKDNRMHITSFRFQENIVPLPFFGMQEDYGDIRMAEDEGDDEMKYSIWP